MATCYMLFKQNTYVTVAYLHWYISESLKNKLAAQDESTPEVQPRIKLKIKPIKEDKQPPPHGQEEMVTDPYSEDMAYMGDDPSDDEESENDASKDDNKVKMPGLQTLFT